jgi:hypothetical protein
MKYQAEEIRIVDDVNRYVVFHRTWWRRNPDWPNGLEPHPGRKTKIGIAVGIAEAQEMCREWNSSHNPGELSRKAEFMEEGEYCS